MQAWEECNHCDGWRIVQCTVVAHVTTYRIRAAAVTIPNRIRVTHDTTAIAFSSSSLASSSGAIGFALNSVINFS